MINQIWSRIKKALARRSDVTFESDIRKGSTSKERLDRIAANKSILEKLYSEKQSVARKLDFAIAIEHELSVDLWGLSRFEEAVGRLKQLRKLVEIHDTKLVPKVDSMLSAAQFAAGDGDAASKSAEESLIALQLELAQSTQRGWVDRLLTMSEQKARIDMMPALVATGMAFEQQGHLNRALIAHQKAVEVATELFGQNDWKVTPCQAGVARVLSSLGRDAEAETLYDEILAKRRAALPSGHDLIASAELAIGKVYLASGKYEKAEHALKSGLATLQKYPKSIEAQIKEGLADLAFTSYNLGDYENAIDAFSQIASFYPEWADLFLYRGLSFLQLGEFQSAIEDLRTCLRHDPKSAEAYMSLAQAYYSLEKPELADGILAEAKRHVKGF